MSTYSEFFLNSKSSVIQLECLQIAHPNFSRTYNVVRNAVQGLTGVIHEDSSSNDYEYYPLKLSLSGPRTDLDQILNVQFGDLGEVIPTEIDNIRNAGAFNVMPTVMYRVYRSDDLTTPLYGPLFLVVKAFAMDRTGAVFDAKAPSLNTNKTGEQYAIARFPMLQSLL